MFLPLGLIFALSVSLFAFETRNYDEVKIIDRERLSIDLEEVYVLPQTYRKKKTPPSPVINIVSDELELHVELNIDDTYFGDN